MLRFGRRTKVLSVAALALLMLVAVAATAFAVLSSTWVRSYRGPDDYTVVDPDPDSTATTYTVVYSSLRSVSALDGTHAWAVGNRKDWAEVLDEPFGNGVPLIAVTSDGSSWEVSSPPGVSGALLGVDAVDATHVWAVGEAGLILKWDGSAWAQRGTGVTDANLRSVSFSDTDKGWAVGDGGVVLRTVDGGTTWTKSPISTTLNLWGVSAPSAGSAFTVGDSGVTGWWNGTSWKVIYAGSNPLRGVTALDSTHAWAVGEQNAFLVWNSGTSTWVARTVPVAIDGLTPADMTPRAVAFTSTMDGIAVGEYSIVWRTSDGGMTWEGSRRPESVFLGGEVLLLGVARTADAPLNAWAVGSGMSGDPTADAFIYRGTLSAIPAGSLAGTVYSAGAPSGLSGVSVQVGSMAAALTITDGSYAVGDITPGDYAVVYSKSGYVTETVSMGIAGGVNTRDVTLISTGDSFTRVYVAGANGSIEGSASQVVPAGLNGTTVTAIADAGYHFERWSDDVATAARLDMDIRADATVTAEFAPTDSAPPYTASNTGSLISQPWLVLTPTDDLSGVAGTWYALDGAPFVPYAGPVLLSRGWHSVAWYSSDVAGNEETVRNGTILSGPQPSITTPRGSTSTRVRRTVTYSGTLTRTTNHRRLTLLAYRLIGADWVLARTRSVIVHTPRRGRTTYRGSIAFTSKGRWKVVARYEGDGYWVQTYSAPRYVTVR